MFFKFGLDPPFFRIHLFSFNHCSKILDRCLRIKLGGFWHVQWPFLLRVCLSSTIWVRKFGTTLGESFSNHQMTLARAGVFVANDLIQFVGSLTRHGLGIWWIWWSKFLQCQFSGTLKRCLVKPWITSMSPHLQLLYPGFLLDETQTSKRTWLGRFTLQTMIEQSRLNSQNGKKQRDLPSRELTYPKLGKRKIIFIMPFLGDMLVP